MRIEHHTDGHLADIRAGHLFEADKDREHYFEKLLDKQEDSYYELEACYEELKKALPGLSMGDDMDEKVASENAADAIMVNLRDAYNESDSHKKDLTINLVAKMMGEKLKAEDKNNPAYLARAFKTYFPAELARSSSV